MRYRLRIPCQTYERNGREQSEELRCSIDERTNLSSCPKRSPQGTVAALFRHQPFPLLAFTTTEVPAPTDSQLSINQRNSPSSLTKVSTVSCPLGTVRHPRSSSKGLISPIAETLSHESTQPAITPSSERECQSPHPSRTSALKEFGASWSNLASTLSGSRRKMPLSESTASSITTAELAEFAIEASLNPAPSHANSQPLSTTAKTPKATKPKARQARG